MGNVNRHHMQRGNAAVLKPIKVNEKTKFDPINSEPLSLRHDFLHA